MSSKQDISNGSTTGLARIAGPHNGSDLRIMLGEGDINRTTGHQHKNGWAF